MARHPSWSSLMNLLPRVFFLAKTAQPPLAWYDENFTTADVFRILTNSGQPCFEMDRRIVGSWVEEVEVNNRRLGACAVFVIMRRLVRLNLSTFVCVWRMIDLLQYCQVHGHRGCERLHCLMNVRLEFLNVFLFKYQLERLPMS